MEALDPIQIASKDFKYLLPVMLPALFGLVALVADLFSKSERSRLPLCMISLSGVCLAGFSAIAFWSGAEFSEHLAGTLSTSAFSTAAAMPVLLATFLISLAAAHHGMPTDPKATGWLPHSLSHGEFYGLLLFATSGMMGLIVANDLVTFFVALEVMSIAVYALTGLDRARSRAAEGAMKYFVLGAFSSGFLLYGMAMIYGAAHSVHFSEIAAANMSAGQSSLALVGAVLFLIGVLFKVGAVPFHAWAPDAYEGATTAVTGFMSVGVKVAAFAGGLRVLVALGAGGALNPAVGWLLWLVAALTVILGNAGALTQRNPRRLLAYSGIAHTGYLVIGLVAVSRVFDTSHSGYVTNVGASAQLVGVGVDAVGGVLFYLLGYAAANLGAIAVLCHLERDGEEVDDISQLAGLAKTQPKSAFAMTVAMVSLAGIPCTAGFIGKLWVFRAGVAAGDVTLVVIALLMSVLSLFYYLRIVVVMWMHEPGRGLDGEEQQVVALDHRRWASGLAVGIATALTLVFGMYPTSGILNLIKAGAGSVF
ncbi:MAG: NADH-quinone oxidoreductase subunit N [Planctomycetes bacterium]|nr:NADH-quinone oxidoreductase subunit N [Planctomycetota bacterium]